MKVSLKWLSKYVDISSLTPEELSSFISKAGTEIEEISYFAKGTNLVVGEVIECEDIEGTHLHKTLVDIKEEKIQIICGAPNCRKGLKVIVALPGCELPVNGGFTIKKGNIRKLDKTNLTYIEPHRIIIKGINFLFFNYSNEIYIENLSTKIKISELQNYIKSI